MNDKKTIEKLNHIREDYKTGKINTKDLIEELKILREMVKDLDPDPLVVKVLRLTYEYLTENDVFNIQFLEENSDDDISDFEYLLELLLHAENEYNREELRELSDVLKSTNA